MTHLHMFVGRYASPVPPVIRKIGMTDLKDALAKGVDDFRAFPTHVIFLCLIYPVVGLMLARLKLSYDALSLLFPLAAGFALIGPFAATGLYELSRRRELGLDVSLKHAVGVRRFRSVAGILALGALLMAIFLLWIATAEAVYVAIFGNPPVASIPEFLHKIVSTPEGWMLIVVGNGIGFLFAAVVLTISVVSFPLLIDRDASAVDAVLTSVRAVQKNPVAIAALGTDRRRSVGDRLAAAVHGTCGRDAGAWALHPAFVPQAGGAGRPPMGSSQLGDGTSPDAPNEEDSGSDRRSRAGRDRS